MQRAAIVTLLCLWGCSSPDLGRHGGNGGSGGGVGGNGSPDMDNGNGGAGGTGGSAGSGGSGGSGGGGGTTYTVYAHSNTDLYTLDIANKQLVHVGAFNAPLVPSGKTMKPDVIQDLAVMPDNTIYVVSKTTLYTADQKDGHVTVVGAVGSLTQCGSDNVALTTTPDNKLYVADYGGNFCEIDVTVKPNPTIMPIGKLGQNMAISGDIVGLGDGSIYGTAYNLGDASKMGTQLSNVLVKLDPKTGAITQQIGATGFPNLFGVGFAEDKVFGFTHDGTGDVILIDPKTGAGTLWNTFTDSAGKGIYFAGAGVNSNVPPPPIS